MPEFEYLCLDTEPLRRAGWPRESLELEEMAHLANLLSIRVFIPEPVEMERRRQWLFALETELRQADEQLGSMSRRLANLTEKSLLTVPKVA